MIQARVRYITITKKSDIHHDNEVPINVSLNVGTIENRILVENELLIVALNTSDSVRYLMELLMSHLSVFATCTDNSNGTGELTLIPEEDEVGTSEGIVTSEDGEFI